MSETSAAMREFRFLDERRKSSALSDAEEQRYQALRAHLQMAPEPAPPVPEPAYAPQGYYAEDGQWYPYPEGYAPQYPPGYDPNAYAYPQGYEYPPAYAYPEYPPGYGYDPNAPPYAYDPSQAAYPQDPSGYAYPPNAYGYPGYPPPAYPPYGAPGYPPPPEAAPVEGFRVDPSGVPPPWGPPESSPPAELPADPYAGAQRLPDTGAEWAEPAPAPADGSWEQASAEEPQAAKPPEPSWEQASAVEPQAAELPTPSWGQESGVEPQATEPTAPSWEQANAVEPQAADPAEPSWEQANAVEPGAAEPAMPSWEQAAGAEAPHAEAVIQLTDAQISAQPLPEPDDVEGVIEVDASEVEEAADEPAAPSMVRPAEIHRFPPSQPRAQRAEQAADVPEADLPEPIIEENTPPPHAWVDTRAENERAAVTAAPSGQPELASSASEAAPTADDAGTASDVTGVEAAPVELEPEAAIDVTEVEAAPVELDAEAAIDVTDLEAAPAELDAEPAIDVTDLAAAPASPEAEPATDVTDLEATIDVTDLEAAPPPLEPDAAIDVTDLEAAPVALEAEAAVDVTDLEAAPVALEAEAAVDVTDLAAAPVAPEAEAAIDVTDLAAAPVAPEAEAAIDVTDLAASPVAPEAEAAIDVTEIEAAPAELDAEASIDVTDLEAAPAPIEPEAAIDVTDLQVAPLASGEDPDAILEISGADVIPVEDSGPRSIDVSFDANEELPPPLESAAEAISAQAHAPETGIALPDAGEPFELTSAQVSTSDGLPLTEEAPPEPFEPTGLAELATHPEEFSTPQQRAAAAAPQAPRWEVGWNDAPAPEPELLLEDAVIEPEPVETPAPAPAPAPAAAPPVPIPTSAPALSQAASLQALPPAMSSAPVPIVHANDLRLHPSAPLFPADEGEAAFIEGEHRVIIHTIEGQVKRGLLRDVDLLDAVIPLAQQTGFAPERIPVERVKAIFFMTVPGSRAQAAAGQKIRVTFLDGRQVAGFSDDFQRPAPGFFIVPADNRTNTSRIFIYRSCVQSVAEG